MSEQNAEYVVGDPVKVTGGCYAPLLGFIAKKQGQGYQIAMGREGLGLRFFVLPHEMEKRQIDGLVP